MFSEPNLNHGVDQPARRPPSKFRVASVRKLHALLGVISALNLLLLITTGLLLQHMTLLHLDDYMVSRRFLPASYRPQDGPEGVRADIVITDLHSGRILGTTGTAILDIITLGWLIMLLTGLIMYTARANGRRNAQSPNNRGPGPMESGSQNSWMETEGNDQGSNRGTTDLPRSRLSQTTADTFCGLRCRRGCRRLVGENIVAMYIDRNELHAALRALGSPWIGGSRAPAWGKSLLVVQAYRCSRGHCHLVCQGAADLRRREESAIVLFEVMEEAAGVPPHSLFLSLIN